jgi:hypothetical protein
VKALLLTLAIFQGTCLNADVLVYRYQGQVLKTASGGCGGFRCGENGEPTFYFTGSLALDESLLPEGSVSNSTLMVTYNVFDGYSAEPTLTFDLQTPTGTFSGDDTPFATYSGVVSDGLFGVVWGSATSYWTFDSNKQITDWFMGGGLNGGSNDFTSSPHGDSVADGTSAGPGVWTLVGSTIPTPVPLPASALLLIGGIGALGLTKRRSTPSA